MNDTMNMSVNVKALKNIYLSVNDNVFENPIP